ncbi:MAG: FecR domain-containing protein [Tannerella sp.]|jgi:ferric-dicitrate binding protein FerR (iron transport regulator)|nr:FecR domain-containing protein [Tannerella sp.]
MEQKMQRKKLWVTGKKMVGYAALIAIAFMIGRMFTSIPVSSSDMAKSSLQELYVPAGQRARITLPDGSTAWLNAGSSLHYPSVFENERKVSLVGEGFFDVAKDADKPFIVATGDIEIKALGTQFNVSNYPKAGMLSATLTNGSIIVYQTGKESSGQILEPNQQLIVENGMFRLEKSIDLDDLLWKEGLYSFKKERMRNIIKKLELYFDVEITVSNPRILEYEYTGKFRQRDGVMEILRIIQKIHHFKIDSNESLNKITLS